MTVSGYFSSLCLFLKSVLFSFVVLWIHPGQQETNLRGNKGYKLAQGVNSARMIEKNHLSMQRVNPLSPNLMDLPHLTQTSGKRVPTTPSLVHNRGIKGGT